MLDSGAALVFFSGYVSTEKSHANPCLRFVFLFFVLCFLAPPRKTSTSPII